MKLWQRYFIKETLKIFLFITVSFYGLYILIDYASHSGSNHQYSLMKAFEFAKYYGYNWIVRADVLVPFALMIAFIRTLSDLNVHNELVALQASGISLKKILRPFLLLGLLFTALMYANTQFLLPKAMTATRHIIDQKAEQQNSKKLRLAVGNIDLLDGTTLLFQRYDSSQNRFLDAYWVKNFHEIWHFQSLYPHETPPRGLHVDRLQRGSNGSLQKQESYVEKAVVEMKFNKEVLSDTLTPPAEYSLSRLWKKLSKERKSEKKAEITATILHKAALPWLCFLAIIAPAPFCVRYGRTHPLFFIYSLSLFFLVGAYLILNSALVISSKQILSPEVAIGAPFMLFFSATFYPFLKAQ